MKQMMFVRSLLTVFVLVVAGCAHEPKDQPKSALHLTSPGNRLVFQRDLAGRAAIPISGSCTLPGASLEARLLPREAGRKPGDWTSLGSVKSDGSFQGRLVASNGWYSLEVRARNWRLATQKAMVERVGVGEVFLVVGHSVAQGGEHNLPGSSDDRVNVIAWPSDSSSTRGDYERTGEPRYLPPLVGTQFSTDLKPVPFGHGPYFWVGFAERVAKAQDVPVMIFNAGFGGTSLEHWAKSVRGEQFEHGFVKSSIRMPYINIYNTLQRYVSVTGIRAVLSDQGQNDAGQADENIVYANYRSWVDQARSDLGFPELSIVVNRQTPGDRTQIRRAQERMIKDCAHCFPGPDYDQMAPADRYDGIHLSPVGVQRAAVLWADALDSTFFKTALPYQPR